MELRVRISDRKIIASFLVIAFASIIGIALAQVSNPGHPWSEIDCAGCIASANLGNNIVTSAKIFDGQVTAADLASNAVTDAKVHDVSWGKITGRPSGLDDGDQDTRITCDWTGWSAAPCASCSGGDVCTNSVTTHELNCQGGIVTAARKKTNCCAGCVHWS
jgi:hypothetical protein